MSQKKIAVIGIPGKWSTEVLADAIEEKTGFRLVMDMREVSADLAAKKLWAHDVDLCEMDGIIVKKISQQYSPHTLDRIELLRLAESRGVRVFTSPEKIVRMIDRLACTMTLSNAGIPMPETIITESIVDAFDAVTKFGAAVFKPLYSTKAQGMTLIEADWPDIQIRNQIKAFNKENPMMYIQKKLDLSGKDYGMVFIGGKYYGTYARVSKSGVWNTTINSGGKYARHKPPQSTIDLAEQAQELFDMDFTTVDVADTPDGPIVFEVSAFGGFRGAKEGLGIDAADLYADYVLAEVGA
jgi:ribosomal protein S6--L-glutamate ligase